jgi:hypothetical protein
MVEFIEQARNQKTCPKCGSTNLIYKNKFSVLCGDCQNKFPRRRRGIKAKNIKPLFEPEKNEEVFYGNRKVGLMRGLKYISFRDKTHFVRKYVSFGITKEVFNLISNKVTEILIIYTKVDGTQEVYYSDVKTWKKYAIEDSLGCFETQLFLPLKYFRKEAHNP